jgi:hypothetical protein
VEPILLLLLAHVDAGKVWFQKFAHKTARAEIGLQKYDQVAPGKEDTSAKYDGGWPQPDGLVKGVETGGGQDETADIGHIREGKDGQGYCSLAGEADGKHGAGLGRTRGVGTAVLDLVLSQIWIVHVSEGIGPLVLVLLDIGLVDPAQRVHEHVIESRGNVSHERHEEEGRLKDMVGEQLEGVDEAIVPRCLIKVEEESQDTNADLDRKDLHQCNDKNEVSFFLVSGIRDRGQRREGREERAEGARWLPTGMATRRRIAMPAATARAACL